MKKQLLMAGFLLAGMLSVKAQTFISFENSEGYNVGNINGQNQWFSTPLQGGGNIDGQNIISTDASDGSNSLKIDKLTAVSPQQSTIVGGFRTFDPAIAINPGNFEVSFDVKISEQSANSSDFALTLLSDAEQGEEEGLYISNIFRFRFNGKIAVVDVVEDELILMELNEAYTWSANTWYSVKIVFTASNNIEYYLNDELIHTGALFRNAPISELRFVHNNVSGYGLIDNIKLGAPSASVDDHLSQQFAMYPNPTTGIVNITNNENVLVSQVNVTDLNGRVVKTVKFDNVSEAQVDISGLSAGMYIMNITTNQGIATKKVVKK